MTLLRLLQDKTLVLTSLFLSNKVRSQSFLSCCYLINFDKNINFNAKEKIFSQKLAFVGKIGLILLCTKYVFGNLLHRGVRKLSRRNESFSSENKVKCAHSPVKSAFFVFEVRNNISPVPIHKGKRQQAENRRAFHKFQSSIHKRDNLQVQKLL